MRKKYINSFLAGVIVLMLFTSTSFAARYENLTVGNLTVERSLAVQGLLQAAANTTGNVFYVDSGAGINAIGRGKDKTKPFATLDYAVGRCTANNGDYIIVMPGHAETMSGTADSVDVDVAGVTIIGLGSGTDMPEFTYDTATDEFVIGATNVTVANLRFVAGVTSITMGISVEAAGDNFTLIGCEFPEPTTSTWEFLDAIDLASGADSVHIKQCTYYNMDATGAAHFIEAGNGVNNDLQVIDCLIMGEFSVAAIWSDTADLEVLIKGCDITNATNGQHAVEFTSTATGLIDNCILRTNATATDLDPGSLTVGPNVYWDDDGTADTVAAPTLLATSGVGSIGGVNDTTTDSLHGKIGTDTEMGDSSLYDLIPNSANTTSWNATALAAIEGEATDAIEADDLDHIMDLDGATQVYPEQASNDSVICKILGDDDPASCATYNNATDSLEAIGAKTDYIASATLPAAPTANSLAAFVASGGTALGTELADSKSIVDALGTDGTTPIDAATSVLGAIGVDDSNNAMATTNVVSNADGSVFERLEAIAAAAEPTYNHPNYITLSVDLTSATWNTAAAHEILTVTGNIRLKIMVECTETLTDAADAATLTLGDEITPAGIIASTSAGGAGAANQLDAGEFWIDATPADVSPVAESSVILDFVVLQGADVGYTIGGEALTDGTLIFHMWWYPLDSTGAATVGAGGAL